MMEQKHKHAPCLSISQLTKQAEKDEVDSYSLSFLILSKTQFKSLSDGDGCIVSYTEEVFEQRQPPLLGHIHLVLQVATVSALGALDFPRQVLYFCLQRRLLVLKLEHCTKTTN